MDDRDQGPDRLTDVFAEFRGVALRQTAVPDPDEPRRRAYRRLRNRTAAPVVAAVAVLFAGAVGVAGNVLVPPPMTTDGSPPVVGPATPSGPAPTGSATPSATATPTPTATGSRTPPTSAAPSGGRSTTASPSAAVVRGLDLSISAPASVTLDPAGGAYTGWLTFTVTNRGDRAYDSNDMSIVVPLDVTIDFADSGIGGCFYQDEDDETRTMFCTGDRRIPAGGSRSYRFGLRVDIAPGSTARTLDGLALTMRANVQGRFPTDRTPGDNTARTALKLPPG